MHPFHCLSRPSSSSSSSSSSSATAASTASAALPPPRLISLELLLDGRLGQQRPRLAGCVGGRVAAAASRGGGLCARRVALQNALRVLLAQVALDALRHVVLGEGEAGLEQEGRRVAVGH